MFLCNYTYPMMGERCCCSSLPFAGWVVQVAGQCLNPKKKGSEVITLLKGNRLAQTLEKER